MNAARPIFESSRILWVEVDEPDNGHGVQFRHDELPDGCIAFLEGFGWLNGGPATVRLLALRPRAIPVERWPSAVQHTLDTVVAFLSSQEKAADFRQGPISVGYNA